MHENRLREPTYDNATISESILIIFQLVSDSHLRLASQPRSRISRQWCRQRGIIAADPLLHVQMPSRRSQTEDQYGSPLRQPWGRCQVRYQVSGFRSRWPINSETKKSQRWTHHQQQRLQFSSVEVAAKAAWDCDMETWSIPDNHRKCSNSSTVISSAQVTSVKMKVPKPLMYMSLIYAHFMAAHH